MVGAAKGHQKPTAALNKGEGANPFPSSHVYDPRRVLGYARYAL